MSVIKNKDIKQFCLKKTATVQECLEVINRNKHGIAIVVDDEGKLIGTVTDGDIRRFLLAGKSTQGFVSEIMWSNPITAPTDSSEKEIKHLMSHNLIRNIPLVDNSGRPCNVVSINEIIYEENNDLCAVVMAGGEGKRLRPITKNIPKPMIKIGEKPILESIIRDFARVGIVNIYVSINYKGNVIEDYFRDGSDYGVKIKYLRESKKLGTVGSLTLMEKVPADPLIVINGDVITETNYLQLVEYHEQHRCVMTVGATQYTINVPYGVVNLQGHYLLGIEEKPQQKFLCNAGIYVINPEIISLIPPDTEFNVTDLIDLLVRKGLPIAAFPIHEQWVDIGMMDDVKKARNRKKR